MSNYSPLQGHTAPATDAFGILYSKVLSIKNYEYKLLNAWFLFFIMYCKDTYSFAHHEKKAAGFSWFCTPAYAKYKLQA